jgi:indolepyruvate ferredoxin oxidoreductase
LTTAVAHEYFRLLAYKDEYEVARLFTQTGFLEQLQADYEGPMRISLHLAPPLLSRIDPTSGRPRKREFGPWIFVVLRWLARLRKLRGGPLDVFGYSRERRMERQLIRDYEALMARVTDELDATRLPLAVALAELPKEIRGFGPVKAAAVACADAKRAELLADWEDVARAGAAEWAAPAKSLA